MTRLGRYANIFGTVEFGVETTSVPSVVNRGLGDRNKTNLLLP